MARSDPSHRETWFGATLTFRRGGEANPARLADAFEPRGDVDVAHQVAVALLDHIPEVDSETELDASFSRQAGVALDHSSLIKSSPDKIIAAGTDFRFLNEVRKEFGI
jgi:hypothetical protein